MTIKSNTLGVITISAILFSTLGLTACSGEKPAEAEKETSVINEAAQDALKKAKGVEKIAGEHEKNIDEQVEESSN